MSRFRRALLFTGIGAAAVLLLILLIIAARVLPEPKAARYYMRDKQNRIVLYHGVNLANNAKSAPDFLSWHTKEDYARLQSWGFNCVRYLVFWEAVEPREGVYNEAYIDATLERMQWMESLGIDVVVDFHQDLYARKFSGNGFPEWTIKDDGIPFHLRQPWNYNYLEKAVLRSYTHFWEDKTLQGKYIAMMEHVIRRIQQAPNLAGIDVMNEPFFGEYFPFESTVLSKFYGDIEAMWKRNNFSTRLFFEPMMLNSGGLPTTLRFRPTVDAVFAPHYYDPFCHEGVGYGRFSKIWMPMWVRQRVKDSQRFRTPLWFGEFGIAGSTAGYMEYLNDFLGLLDKYHAGWTYYSYDKAGMESFGVVDDAMRDKPQIYVLVRPYPQRIAGDNPAFSYTEKAFELTYQSNESTAPTIVFIPPRFDAVQAQFNGHPVPYDGKTGLLMLTNEGPVGSPQRLQATWK